MSRRGSSVAARRVPVALAFALGLGFASHGDAGPAGKIVKIEHEPPMSAPRLGPRLAPVTIEFFFDPGERASKRFGDLLSELSARHPERLRVIYRIVSKRRRSTWQAEAAREAFARGRFTEFLQAFYANHRWPHRDDLRTIAQTAGLDPDAMEKVVLPNESPHAQAVMDDYWLSRRRRVSSIPGLLINGEPKLLSQNNIDELESLYDQAYDAASVRLEDGMRPEDLYPRLLREADAAVEYPVGLVAGSVDGLTGRDKPPGGMGALISGSIDAQSPLSRGADNPEIVLSFFCNFQTRNCKGASDNIEELRAMFPELRVVFHHQFDEEDKRQPFARRLAEAAACAHDQGAFWSVHDDLFSSYVSTNISEDDVMARAEKLELDVERFRACFVGRQHTETIEDAREIAERAGVTFTPSVVIGGRVYLGLQSTHVLRDLLLVELSPGVLETLLSE
jgi:protein-disulfide isomerase